MSKVVTAKSKTKALVRYAKDHEIRSALTLGIIFRLWSDLEILEKGVFLNDLSLILEEPLLIIAYDNAGTPTKLTCDDIEYTELNSILAVMQSSERYYVYLVFPGSKPPAWFQKVCEPNPYAVALPRVNKLLAEIQEKMAFDEAFGKVYKQALMVLVDEALDHRDKKLFLALARKLKGTD